AAQLYYIFGNLVSTRQAEECFSETSCARSRENPAASPPEKCSRSTGGDSLGGKWTLSPEDYMTAGHANTTYLGYSIESQCSKHAFIPHAQRTPRQVYILAKLLKFFIPKDTSWPPDFFDAAANATEAGFLMAAVGNPNEPLPGPSDVATNIKNVGGVRQDEFYALLSHSAALSASGALACESPTPYDALCHGVPFINPIAMWNEQDPTDRTKWRTQHDMLRHLSAPYVYHVFRGDRDGFVNAVRDVLANPIESHIPERMKMASVEHRLGIILEHDCILIIITSTTTCEV
ncbi:hypothetical protein DFH09DRAFT_898771, partial [Mycena vulgaris]